jgi:hypothetical protein
MIAQVNVFNGSVLCQVVMLGSWSQWHHINSILSIRSNWQVQKQWLLLLLLLLLQTST